MTRNGNDSPKTILLTFDVELFFRKSGSARRSILEPVDRLLEIFAQTGTRATFFIDTLYLQKMRDTAGLAGERELLENQIQWMVAGGHRAELHLHPHWLDAEFRNGEWIFPTYRSYRLQTLPPDRITDLIVKGANLINGIAGRAIPGYRVKAYRAGGWCIQPFQPLADGFRQAGIRIDSSVVPGMTGDNGYHQFDFRASCRNAVYRFTTDPLKEDPNGEFLEVSITPDQRSMVRKSALFLDRVFRRKSYRACGDGQGLPMKTDFWSRLAADTTFLTLERVSPRALVRTVRSAGCSTLTFLSHPKNMSASSYECIRRLAGEKGFSFLTLTDLL